MSNSIGIQFLIIINAVYMNIIISINEMVYTGMSDLNK